MRARDGQGGEEIHYFPPFSFNIFFFALKLLITDRKTFIIFFFFRSLFLPSVNKSFSLLGFRFSLPTNPLNSMYFAFGESDVIAIVELSSQLSFLLLLDDEILFFFYRKKKSGSETINIKSQKYHYALLDCCRFFFSQVQWYEMCEKSRQLNATEVDENFYNAV